MPEFLTPTGELEAVNLMLANIGASPVDRLTGTLAADAIVARRVLHGVSRRVQNEGWHFNTEDNYPLSRDVNNEIPLPPNLLRVDAVLTAHPTLDPVARGARLYDKASHSFLFDTNISANIVLLLPFEDLPEYARLYIVVRAARQFQQDTIGSDTLSNFDQTDEARARADMIRADGANENLNMLDNMGSFHPGDALRRR
jgi:hypothetical protein